MSCCGSKVGCTKTCLGAGFAQLAIAGACAWWGVLFCFAWLGENPNTEFFREWSAKQKSARVNHTQATTRGFDDVWDSEFEHNWLQAWYFNPGSALVLLTICALPCCIAGPVAIACAHVKMEGQIRDGRVDSVLIGGIGAHAKSPFSRLVAAFSTGAWLTGCSIVTSCCGFCFLVMSIGPVGYFFIRVVFFGLPTGLIMLLCCSLPLGIGGGLFAWRAIVRLVIERRELAYATHDASATNHRAIDTMPVAQVVSLTVDDPMTTGGGYAAPMLPGDRLGLDAPMLSPAGDAYEHEVL